MAEKTGNGSTRVTIIGQSGSGKTNMLASLMFNQNAMADLEEGQDGVTDIPQVACRSTPKSPKSACRSSVLGPERRLRAPERSNAGRSGRKLASFWPSIAVLQRGGQNCPAAFVQFLSGSLSRT